MELCAARSRWQRRIFTFQFKNTKAHKASFWRLDNDHGNVLREYAGLGSPRYPAKSELEKLRAVDQTAAMETAEIKNNQLTLSVPSKGLVVIELR